MSKTLADQAIAAIEKRAVSKAQPDAVKLLDWSIWIPAIMNVLSQLLTGCLNKNQPEAVAKTMSTPGFYRERRLKQAARIAARQEGIKPTPAEIRAAVSACGEELDDTDQPTLVAFLQELKSDDDAADWSILKSAEDAV